MHNLDISAPLLLVLEVTNRCNLQCAYCYNNLCETDTKDMDFHSFMGIIEEAKSLAVFDINLSGGEPFLHSNIISFIDKIISSNLGISIVSNGTLISKDLSRILAELGVTPYIQISFDSCLEETHNKTRQLFKKAFTGFYNLVEQIGDKNLSPSIGIVVNKNNVNNIIDTITFFSEYTSRFHLMNVMKHCELSMSETQKKYFLAQVLPELETIANKKSLSISILKNRMKKSGYTASEVQKAHIDCLAGFTSLVIKPTLEIYPCDMSNQLLGTWQGIGSLLPVYEKSKTIWRNRKNPWCID